MKSKPLDEDLAILVDSVQTLVGQMEALVEENRKMNEKFNKLRLKLLGAVAEFLNEIGEL